MCVKICFWPITASTTLEVKDCNNSFWYFKQSDFQPYFELNQRSVLKYRYYLLVKNVGFQLKLKGRSYSKVKYSKGYLKIWISLMTMVHFNPIFYYRRPLLFVHMLDFISGKFRLEIQSCKYKMDSALSPKSWFFIKWHSYCFWKLNTHWTP